MDKFVPYIFNKKEVIKNFENDKQYDNWIMNQVKSRKVVKVRNGLYVKVNELGYPLITKFEIATKISYDAYVCYHSALEYYGVANQVFNSVTVGTTIRFNNFTFNDIEYLRKPFKINAQIVDSITADIRVTSLERTIIDCIEDIEEGGGIEEILNAIDQIRTLDENKLLEVLKEYDSVFLYQKVGFILEHYKEKFMMSDKFFYECKKHLTNQVKYFLKDEYREISYNSTWKLMAPRNLKSQNNGVY